MIGITRQACSVYSCGGGTKRMSGYEREGDLWVGGIGRGVELVGGCMGYLGAVVLV